jgi:homoserine O-acetyltransferase/O-succinyltransferase
MIAMITYQSEESMQPKFGRTSSNSISAASALRREFEVEHYLHYQGEKLVARFDATSYLCLLRAIDLFDPSRGYPSQDAALDRIEADVLVASVSSDILYPPHQQRELAGALERLGKRVRCAELVSPWGHDAFLLEVEPLGRILAGFIGK